MKLTALEKVKFTGHQYKPYSSFWKGRISDFSEGFYFKQISSMAGPRMAVNQKEFRLEKSVGEALLNLVQKSDSGIFNCLLSAFGILLFKYTGQSRIVIDSPLFKLNKAEEVYAEKVPLPMSIEANALLKELLSNTQNTIRDCYKYQNYPLDLITDDSSHEIFSTNILISYDQIHLAGNNLEDYDLAIDIKRIDDDIQIILKYNSDVFEDYFIDQIQGHLTNVLRHLGDLNVTVKEIGILTENELTLINNFNDTYAHYPKDKTVQELFELQSAITPEAIAVSYGDVSVTYKELDQSANNLAAYLREENKVGPGDIIGIMADRSELLIIGILGILKSGAAYLPIDPEYPDDRKEYILKDAKVKVLLTESTFMFSLGSYQGALFALDIQLNQLEQRMTLPLSNKASDCAYVIYTSGSTGQPKGVKISHSSLVNLCCWHKTAFNVDENSKATLYSVIGFDASVWETWPYLLSGACLFPLKDELRLDVYKLINFFNEKKITHSFLPTAMCEPLSELSELIQNKTLLILTGGDKLHRVSPTLNIVNNYGPTESTVVTTSVRLNGDIKGQIIPIGKPISNIQVHILDGYLNRLPVGMEGEIYISGEGVAIGYVNASELTEEKFIKSPFDNSSNGRLYKTGDRGRWLPDGNIEFKGRQDHQIKIRGFRIELGEIESVIRQHPGVEEAYAYVVEEQENEKVLAAVFTPHHQRAYTINKTLRLKPEQPHLYEKLYQLPNGLNIVHKNKSETDFIYKEIFEDHIYLQNGINIQAGDVVFDVGANIGLFSLFVGLHFKDVKVYAFEPLQPISEVLKANLSLYDIDVTAFEFGLADAEAKIYFKYFPYLTAISGRYGNEELEKDTVRKYLINQSEEDNIGLTDQNLEVILQERMVAEELQSRVRRLSDVIKENNIEKIDLLKIDVEKSELDVLLGIDDEDWAKIKQIAIEAHNIDSHVKIIHSLLQSKGYEVTVVQENILKKTNIYNIFASRSLGKESSVHASSVIKNFRNEDSWTNLEELTQSIKDLCLQKLPAYMAPQYVFCLESLPLMPNQKIDRKALPSPFEMAQEVVSKAPSGDIEQLLKEVWEDVLQKKNISIDSSFFEIGGDSIKAIQIAVRVQKAGYKLEVRDLFQHSSIEELAPFVRTLVKSTDQSPVAGEIPLASIQKYFFSDPKLIRHHFNQAVMFHAPQGFDKSAIQAVFSKIVEHHDILRVTYNINGEEIKQINNDLSFPFEIESYDFTHNPNPITELETSAERLQQSFDLEKGPLIKVAQYHLPDGDRLLIIIHHLIIDTVSWRILFEDIGKLYQQYLNKEELKLPLKTDSFKTWAERLIIYADSEEFLKEKKYWAQAEASNGPLLVTDLEVRYNYLHDTALVSLTLDEQDTELLLTEVHKAFNTEINDILLTALSLAVYKSFGLERISVMLEGHGREQIIEEVDISRTVGWFSSIYPIILSVSDFTDIGSNIKNTKEYLRRIPNKGVGYGILKYLTSAQNKQEVSFNLTPWISFNYLGQFDSDVESSSFNIARESAGNQISPQSQRNYLLEISGMIAGKSLNLSILYNKNHYNKETITNLKDEYKAALTQIISYCMECKTREKTLSDFYYKELSVEDLDSIFE